VNQELAEEEVMTAFFMLPRCHFRWRS